MGLPPVEEFQDGGHVAASGFLLLHLKLLLILFQSSLRIFQVPVCPTQVALAVIVRVILPSCRLSLFDSGNLLRELFNLLI